MRKIALVLALLCAGCTATFGPEPGWVGWTIRNEANLDFEGLGMKLCIGCLAQEAEADPNSPAANAGGVP